MPTAQCLMGRGNGSLSGAGVLVLKTLFERKPVSGTTMLRLTAMVICSAVLYFAVNAGFRLVVPERSEYMDSLLQIGFLFQNPITVIGRTLNATAGVYGLTDRVYGGALWGVPIVLGLGAVALFKALSWAPARHRAFLLLGAISLLVLPFAMHLVSAGLAPTRGLVAVPFAVWLFTYIAIVTPNRPVRLLTTVSLSLSLFQILVVHNSFQASNFFAAKHDEVVAASMYERLTSLPEFDPTQVYPIAVFGSRPFNTSYPRPLSSTVGHSFFEWDGGNPWRIASYMSMLGLGNLTGPTRQQIDSTIIRLARLPVWPAKDSVQIVDGIVLVRLGETASSLNVAALKRVGG
jgi:hypothetical protein